MGFAEAMEELEDGPGRVSGPFWGVLQPNWWFTKIRGTLLGVPIVRIIVFWDLHWGPLILGNYQLEFCNLDPKGPRTQMIGL